MSLNNINLLLIAPEIIILITACLILLLDLARRKPAPTAYHILTLLGLMLAFIFTWSFNNNEHTIGFSGNVMRDGLTNVLQGAILLLGSVAFIYARPWLKDRELLLVEFYVLGLFAILGMLIMIAANSFLTLYLGLELQALSFYTLVAFNRESQPGAEAAMKYFVLGALGSGMLLYGISMIYGATGSIEFSAVAQAITEKGISNRVLDFGIAFLVIGIGFKFGAVPFHMWVPDVYQGAPTPTVLLISSLPKIAAFAIAIRILVNGMQDLHADWQEMLIVLAVLSLTLGNLVAIAQTNIKRMLAYSTIAHVGFLLLGIASSSPNGYAATMFYVIIYALTAIGAFGVLLFLSRAGFDAERIEDLKGLNDRDSWYAAILTLILFSMAGVPPTVGFIAKLLILKTIIEANFLWLAIIAVIFSVIGAFYYLRVIKYIYFDRPTEPVLPFTATNGVRFTLITNGLVLFGLGFFPETLLTICQTAFA